MLLPLLGATPDPVVERRAVDLGVAIQLTNVLRDVGADARDYDRVYLPLADLAACGCDLEDVRKGRLTAPYKDAVRLQISRARDLCASARLAIPDLPKASRLPVAAIVALEASSTAEARDCDSLSGKLRPSAVAVARAVVRAFLRS
ncbi:farnesyl-diphosphate farnesyltransferase [Aureococcus anophagefferens]|nr:farnesyl-diphosphate farnesyltransferase [Aureococcus anophagefferens]